MSYITEIFSRREALISIFLMGSDNFFGLSQNSRIFDCCWNVVRLVVSYSSFKAKINKQTNKQTNKTRYYTDLQSIKYIVYNKICS